MDQKKLSHFPLYVVIFVGFIGYSLMITIFTPLFLLNKPQILPEGISLSVKLILLGFVLFLYPFGQIFSFSLLNNFLHKMGRKNVLIIAVAINAICYALIAIALNTNRLMLLIIALIVAGLFESSSVIAQSTLTKVITYRKKELVSGYVFIAASTAYIVGPLFGGKLTDKKLAFWFSNSTPFWIVSGLLFLTVVWMIFSFIENKKEPKKTQHFMVFDNVKSIFKDKSLRVVYFSNFFLYLAIFGFFRCYPMYLVNQFQLEASRLSEFIAWVAVPIILANLWLTTFLGKRFASRSMIIVTGILTGIFMIFVIFSNSVGSLWVTLFLTSLALALCLHSCATFLSEKANERKKEIAMNNNQTLQIGAEAFSGLVAGLLAAISIKLSLIILGIFLIVVASSYIFRHQKSKSY